MSVLRSLFGGGAPRSVEIESLGVGFDVPRGKTILEAALAAGIAFPHDCTVGTCGTCKARLTRGRVDALSEFAYTLSSEELAANFILPCQSVPRDALVRIDVEVPIAVPARQQFSAQIVGTMQLTHDILQVRMQLDLPIHHVAGQYANLSAPGMARERSYSFAEAPEVAGCSTVTFFVRKVPGGEFTEALFAGRLTGQTIRVDGPHGNFHLRESTSRIVCIAGGSGLAPILSMLADAVRRSAARPCVLLFGARTEADLYALDRIESIRRQWPAPFAFTPVLSHEPDGSAWGGTRGLVTEQIAGAVAGADPTGCQAYLCGPPAMIDAGVAQLTQRGVALGSIFYDKFTDASHVVTATSRTGSSSPDQPVPV